MTDKLPARWRWPVLWIWRAGQRWLDASGPQLGASIAFYTMFALAPLLAITIAIAGLVFGVEAARGQIVDQISGVVGVEAARAIQAMIESAWRTGTAGHAVVLGVVTLLVGATGVFAELRRALNAVGRTAAPPSALAAFVRVRLVAFALLLGLGFLAIASLLLSAAVSALAAYVARSHARLAVLATLFDLLVPTLVLTVAFAALLRWLPDRPPGRRAAWTGAVASSVLFTAGKYLIGLYLGRAAVSSSFGAAGSFAVVMLWVYYSAQILLFGAALGQIEHERQLERRGA